MDSFKLWPCLFLCLATPSVSSDLDVWNCTQLTNDTSANISQCTVFVNHTDLYECPDENYSDNECDIKCNENCLQCMHDIRRNESTCTTCRENYYLTQDNICRPCPAGCLSGTGVEPVCRTVDGECLHGCTPGYYGSHCNRKCSSFCFLDTCDRLTGCCVEECWIGYYCGCNCYRRCSGSCLDQSCNLDCSCKYGCVQGFAGPSCSIRCSENCEESCNQTNAHCLLGCREKKWWGDRCEFLCSSQCKYTTCTRYNGSCTHGCETEHWYGHNCTKQCNQNCIDSTCLQSTGECKTGCKDGWYGPDCSKRCSKNCLDQSCNRDNGTCKYQCRRGYYGNNCESICNEHCKNRVCDFESGHCFSCVIGWNGENCNVALVPSLVSKNSQVSTWAYVSGALILAAFTIVVIGIVLLKKHRCRPLRDDNNYDTTENIQGIQNRMYESLSKRHNKANYQIIGKLDIRRFLKNTYDTEMEFVKSEIKVLMEELDISQQEMLSLDGGGGDYIVMEFENETVSMAVRKSTANTETRESNYRLIDGFRWKKYIVWMGSYEEDVTQFLQTIWTQGSSLVVHMAPVRANFLLEQDTFNITEDSSSVLAEVNIKKIRITNENEERLVSVLEVRDWSDAGTLPPVVDFVDFHQKLRGLMKTLHSKGPIMVHCGDNLDRAGMFVSLDYVVDEIVETDYVDVRQAVSGLRQRGLGTLWNMEKLCYMYESVAMSVVCSCEPVHRNQISAFIQNFENLHIDEHLTIKQTFMRHHFEKDGDQSYGSKYIEVSFYKNIQVSESESDYYNFDIGHGGPKAVHADSYRRRNAFVCMELPTPESVAGFIHMVMQSDVGLIVLLDALSENQLPWNITAHTDHLSIAATSVYRHQKLVWNTVMFDDASDEENLRRHVSKYVQYTDWSNSEPEVTSILDLLDIVRQEHCQQPDRPILVQSRENSRCALFCALYNLLEIADNENYFNVLSTIEKIWSRFPGTIISVEHVKFCFEALIFFMKMNKNTI